MSDPEKKKRNDGEKYTEVYLTITSLSKKHGRLLTASRQAHVPKVLSMVPDETGFKIVCPSVQAYSRSIKCYKFI